ncbi:MAG: hypothetical protein ACOCP8_06135 [archaeon]
MNNNNDMNGGSSNIYILLQQILEIIQQLQFSKINILSLMQ